MITTVYGSDFAVDSWTGESFNTEVKFKIPKLERGKVKWTGSYAVPSSAIAAMKDYWILQELPPEKTKELWELWMASVYVIKDSKSMDKDFVPEAAPDPAELTTLCKVGRITLEQYHKNVKWEYQRETYRQRIPATEDETTTDKQAAASSTASTTKKRSEPSHTKINGLSIGTKKEKIVPVELGQLPRNMSAWFTWLWGMAIRTKGPGASSITVTFEKPRGKSGEINTIVLTQPEMWGEVANPRASSIVSKNPVYGSATVISRHDLSKHMDSEPVPEKKKQKAAVESDEEESGEEMETSQ